MLRLTWEKPRQKLSGKVFGSDGIFLDDPLNGWAADSRMDHGQRQFQLGLVGKRYPRHNRCWVFMAQKES
jgi:hypothetical protein